MRVLLLVFISGAVVMALELLGSRLLAPVFGNSIFVWGSLIGVVLSALSAGYYFGGELADRQPNLQTLSTVVFAAGLLIIALPTLTPLVFDAVIKLNMGERYSPLLATALLLAPPSILLGMVSPYSVRLVARSVEKVGGASGNLFVINFREHCWDLRHSFRTDPRDWSEQDHPGYGCDVAGRCLSRR